MLMILILKMCYQFMLYYPRMSGLQYCASSPDFREFGNFLQKLNE